MSKEKKMKIVVNRVNHNKFIVGKKVFNYFELLNWFTGKLTE